MSTQTTMLPRRAAAVLPLLIACHGGRSATPAPPTPSAPAVAATESSPIRGAAPFRWKGPAGSFVSIRNVNGTIRATPTTDAEAEIVAEMRDGDDGAGVVVERTAEGVTFCVTYDAAPERTCRDRMDHSSHRHRDAVDFTVKVPQNVRFVARTVNGAVYAQGLTFGIDVESVNGALDLESVVDARGSTVNGSIHATFARADWSRPVELTTVNGEVVVTFPPNTNADLRADTVHGRVPVNLPVAGQLAGSHVHTSLGTGGHDVRLRTVHGSIKVD